MRVLNQVLSSSINVESPMLKNTSLNSFKAKSSIVAYSPASEKYFPGRFRGM
jgi:hypothetical protein